MKEKQFFLHLNNIYCFLNKKIYVNNMGKEYKCAQHWYSSIKKKLPFSFIDGKSNTFDMNVKGIL